MAIEHIGLLATGYRKLTLMRVSVTGSHLNSALIITGKYLHNAVCYYAAGLYLHSCMLNKSGMTHCCHWVGHRMITFNKRSPVNAVKHIDCLYWCSFGQISQRQVDQEFRIIVYVWGRRGGCIRSWWGNRRERDHWGDLGVDGWIILGWISRRWDVGMWNGLGWPRIGTGGGRLWVR